jgi:hypothetical protein
MRAMPSYEPVASREPSPFQSSVVTSLLCSFFSMVCCSACANRTKLMCAHSIGRCSFTVALHCAFLNSIMVDSVRYHLRFQLLT